MQKRNMLNPFRNHSQHFVTQRLYHSYQHFYLFHLVFIAYGVSRYKVLSETRMFQLLMLRMVPPIVLVGPLSLYYTTIGLIDSLTGLIAIYFITTLPYAVWMTKALLMKSQ